MDAFSACRVIVSVIEPALCDVDKSRHGRAPVGEGISIPYNCEIGDVCTFKRTLPRTGITDICRKSFLISSEGRTLGTGLTSACS